jgi:hypothetical protein
MTRFSGRIRLLAVGFIAIALIQTLLAAYLSNRVGAAAVEREARVAQKFLVSMLRAQNAGELFVEPGPSPALAALTGQIAHLPDLIRANVYSPDGIIRFSTQEGLIGVRFEAGNPELDEAFAGKLEAELGTLTATSKAEHLALPLRPGESFIESYVPIPAEDGKIVAVVELYRRSAGLEAGLSALTQTIWLAAALGGVALSALLAAMLTYIGRPVSQGA